MIGLNRIKLNEGCEMKKGIDRISNKHLRQIILRLYYFLNAPITVLGNIDSLGVIPGGIEVRSSNFRITKSGFYC